jgi:predicted CopG family antitoxin
MTMGRLAVRIDPEQKRKLVEMARREGGSISDVIRKLIDQAYESDRREYLLGLIDEMSRLNIEDVPEPDELSRQLAAKYDFEHLC